MLFLLPRRVILSVGKADGLTGLTYRFIWSTFKRTMFENLSETNTHRHAFSYLERSDERQFDENATKKNLSIILILLNIV